MLKCKCLLQLYIRCVRFSVSSALTSTSVSLGNLLLRQNLLKAVLCEKKEKRFWNWIRLFILIQIIHIDFDWQQFQTGWCMCGKCPRCSTRWLPPPPPIRVRRATSQQLGPQVALCLRLLLNGNEFGRRRKTSSQISLQPGCSRCWVPV